MGAPLIRRYTRGAPAALNVFALATDDVTGLTFTRLPTMNQILDMLNDPDPAAGLTYIIEVAKEGIPTGRRIPTSGISPASAGRVAVGPIDVRPGNLNYSVSQTAGALTATSFVVKYATGF